MGINGPGGYEDDLDVPDEEPPFDEAVVDIAMRLDYGEITSNEAVAELAVLTNVKGKFPITRALLRKIGVNGTVVLTHEDFDRAPVMDFVTREGEWISIEAETIPEETGAPFDHADELGDHLRGVLEQHPEKGFCLHAPDHRLYPLDAAALAPLADQGGPEACVGKEIWVLVDVGETMKMTAVAR